ncbi:type II secretion system GspH family protein [bacterium]|nr:type II secretion system GspH family protein [bacterium]
MKSNPKKSLPFMTQNRHRQERAGFTLVEMLIAMTVTLLMMAALARAFAFVGTRIQESRADTQLASNLRDITTRIQSDLAQCTVELTPNSGLEEDQKGYFLYYEGPVTDATSSLFRVKADAQGNVESLPDSRYGDFDDYLAFTAVAKGNQWFTGRVPRYLLDRKSIEANLPAGTLYSGPTGPPQSGESEELITITSKYAEIIYFASPEYDRSSTKVPPDYLDIDGTDMNGDGIIDANEVGNGLPDRLNLYRRVLLIRPDLNLSETGSITAAAMGETSLGTSVHQKCDLSVRRVLGANGLPTTQVAANSLSDLSKPHNRFAHYRVVQNGFTSMPLLVLGPPATILTRPGNISPASSTVTTPTSRSGFLRPEFILTGDRIGEDLVTNNALGFDIQIFDPDARFYTLNETVGPSDAGYRSTLISSDNIVPESGEFVDLGYPVLAGGSLRGWEDIAVDSRGALRGAIPNPGSLVTYFSGLKNVGGNAVSTYSDGMYKSGRVYANGNQIAGIQPVFDTFTSSYERDGFVQRLENGFMKWYAPSSAPIEPDLGANGLDDAPFHFGADDITERETLPPCPQKAEAVRVTVRLENPSLRFVRQASVEYRGK